MATYRPTAAGDSVPTFRAPIGDNPRFNFDTIGGRYGLIGCFGALDDTVGRAAMQFVRARRRIFDDRRLVFFGVTTNPKDEAAGLTENDLPGLRYVRDFDGMVSRLFGALPAESAKQPGMEYRRKWIVFDPMLRVIAVVPITGDGSEQAELDRVLANLTPIESFTCLGVHAPVLALPNVLEPALCERLIKLHVDDGGKESGFMREVDGKTVMVHDHGHKRRTDFMIEDRDLMLTLQDRFRRRVIPEIQKAFQFPVTRMERYLVGCYEADNSGHFNAHRDNTTKGTAHRRFAASVNLNSDFEGGNLSFPEYGPRQFKPPPGAVVVFSCSLLHEVSAVTRGRRYAFLPFLYDEEAVKIRIENNKFLGDGVGAYGTKTAPAA